MSDEEIANIKKKLDLLDKLTDEFGDYKSIWSIKMNLNSRLKYYGIDDENRNKQSN